MIPELTASLEHVGEALAQRFLHPQRDAQAETFATLPTFVG
jgi:hypothetical protein